jgi:hypothetical protein
VPLLPLLLLIALSSDQSVHSPAPECRPPLLLLGGPLHLTTSSRPWSPASSPLPSCLSIPLLLLLTSNQSYNTTVLLFLLWRLVLPLSVLLLLFLLLLKPLLHTSAPAPSPAHNPLIRLMILPSSFSWLALTPPPPPIAHFLFLLLIQPIFLLMILIILLLLILLLLLFLFLE